MASLKARRITGRSVANLLLIGIGATFVLPLLWVVLRLGRAAADVAGAAAASVDAGQLRPRC